MFKVLLPQVSGNQIGKYLDQGPLLIWLISKDHHFTICTVRSMDVR